MTSVREEYIKCVQHTHAEKLKTSWCGRILSSFDLAFQTIDHAAYTRLQDGRLLICPQCKHEIIKTLKM